MLIGALLMLLITDALLSAIVLALIAFVVIPVVLIARRVRRLTRASQDRIAQSSGMAGESLEAIHMVQAYTLERSLSERFHRAVEQAFAAGVARARARATLTAIAITLIFGAVVLVLWLGTQSVLAGDMSAGELGQFVMFAVMVAVSAASLSEMWSELQRAAGALARIDELFRSSDEVAKPTQPRPLPRPLAGAIDFDGVTFRYPSRAHSAALDDFHLHIEPGQTVALVGPSGAGKSTVFQLLLRFYLPQQGRVLIDGIDIKDIEAADLRQQIALVPQETVIFSGTVAENIALGVPDADTQAIHDAARAAGVFDFLDELPQGFDTFLGERGTRLSGGQRQRIAIARALLRDPALLLLDEATSALDAVSQHSVQQAFETLMRQRTTLVIAHRLATVRAADRIVVMDAGRVVATGRHEDLLQTQRLVRKPGSAGVIAPAKY